MHDENGKAGSLSMTSCLIVDCPNDVCKKDINEPTRNADGRREWTAEFEPTGSTNAEGWCWWPVKGYQALQCPDCGTTGRVWSY